MKYLSNFFCGVAVTLSAAITIQFDWFAAIAAVTAFLFGAVFSYGASLKETDR